MSEFARAQRYGFFTPWVSDIQWKYNANLNHDFKLFGSYIKEVKRNSEINCNNRFHLI